MKKYLIIFLIICVMTGIFISISLRKKQYIGDLFLKNIECLASPENSNNGCLGAGSLDCPWQNFMKVKYIWS